MDGDQQGQRLQRGLGIRNTQATLQTSKHVQANQCGLYPVLPRLLFCLACTGFHFIFNYLKTVKHQENFMEENLASWLLF